MSFKLSKIFKLLNICFIISIFFISLCSDVFIKKRIENNLFTYANKVVVLKAQVCKEEEIKVSSRQLILCYEDSKILITTNLYPEYKYGDYLEITGVLQIPENFSDFNYNLYLARYGIYYTMYYPKLTLLNDNKLSFIQSRYQNLLNFKQGIRQIINIGLPEPAASIANAILLGYKKTISQTNRDIFSKVGLSHLIAISGTHIGILSAILLIFLRIISISKRLSFKILCVFLILFPILTGLSASTIRAAIMGYLAMLALENSYVKSNINIILFSASLMLLFNPLLLLYDIGFQLSYLAVLAINYIFPLLEYLREYVFKKLNIKKHYKFIKKIIAMLNISLSVQIITIPIIVFNFKQLSLISPLANILVVFLFPVIFTFLLIAIVLAFILPSLIKLWFFPVYICISYVYETAYQLSLWNLAAKEVLNFKASYIFLYYLILIPIIYILRTKILNNKKNKD